VFLEWLPPLQSQRDAAARHRGSVEASIKKALQVYLFRETGSFRHGTGVRHYTDVDLLVSIANDRPGSSETALGWIKNALKESFPDTTVRVSRPAVVVEFAGGDETWEIIPGFLTGRPGYVYDIPGASGGWMDTAPQERLSYVNECNSRPDIKGGAKKLARLIKAWKYYNNVPISSFYLEMRAAQHMTTQTSFVPHWDISGLLNSLGAHQLAGMNDAKGKAGRFYACSSDAKRIEALSKLSTATTRASNALKAYLDDDHDEAFRYYDLLFGGRFPAR
jgi:hypothetical protein